MSLVFKTPEIDDAHWVRSILSTCCSISAEDTFGSIFIWSQCFDLKICRYKNFLLRKFVENGQKIFTFPVGTGDLHECIKALFAYANSQNIELIFSGVTQKNVDVLANLYNKKIEYLEEKNREDYIYNASDLIKLKGKKYHSKRNHIAKFSRMHKWKFEEISAANLDECKIFCDKWFLENLDKKRADIVFEKEAVERAFRHYDELNFLGGIIRVENEIAALTFGEKINKFVFNIQIEKALQKFSSAYAVINNEFAKKYLSNFSYINRQEDMGIPTLQKAKMSYHPVALLKKYKVFLGNLDG